MPHISFTALLAQFVIMILASLVLVLIAYRRRTKNAPIQSVPSIETNGVDWQRYYNAIGALAALYRNILIEKGALGHDGDELSIEPVLPFLDNPNDLDNLVNVLNKMMREVDGITVTYKIANGRPSLRLDNIRLLKKEGRYNYPSD